MDVSISTKDMDTYLEHNRQFAEKLEGDKRVRSYRVECTNYESIHQHDAYAAIGRDKRERDKK